MLTAVIMAYIVACWIIVKGIIRIIAAIRLHQIKKAPDTKILGRNWGKMVAIGIFVGISIISSGINLITFAMAKPE